jgi:hypothetical protein
MSDLQSSTRPARPLQGSRWSGVILLLIGLGVSYLEIVEPLQEAAQGVRSVTWNDSWSFAGLLLTLLGIVAVIFPKILSEGSFMFKSKGKLSISGWLLLGVLIAGAFAFSALVHNQFAKLGYQWTSPS